MPAGSASPATRSPTTLVQLTWTFVPFALFVTIALLYPELSQNLRLFRTIYLIRASLLLTVPALVLLPFLRHGSAARNLWRLFWTFGLIAHLAHLAYAVFFVFGDQLETARLHPDLYGLSKDNVSIYSLMVEQQRAPVVWGNIAATVVWLVDVLLAWFCDYRNAKAAFFHWFTWVAVIVTFLISTVYFFKNPISYNLGIGLIVVVGIALVMRAFWRPPLVSTAAAWSSK
jgi:hypothetical protein